MTREPATRSMSGQCVITFFTFTLFRAISSSGPYPPAASAPGIWAFQNDRSLVLVDHCGVTMIVLTDTGCSIGPQGRMWAALPV